MTFKLAFRNMKKSMSDYAVYFVTLIIGISVFYVFNAIKDQSVMKIVFARNMNIIDLLGEALSIASVIVSIVLAFLIVYASNFLMKRRKKEFGIYMLLGMKKKKIAGILMSETVIIGALSLVVGLGLGIILSQGMSVLVASLYEADMSRFEFDVSGAAILKTIGYFLVMFLLVLILDIIVVGKSRLLSLLNAHKRSEKNIAVNPWICTIVFVIAGGVLASAYYMVTTNATQLDQTGLLVQVIKGIVTTFLIFWSISGLFVFISKLRKKSYMKGLNAFTVREIGGRINTNVFAGSIICLMLFITICILATSLSINKSINDNLNDLVRSDINIIRGINEESKVPANEQTVQKTLNDKKVDMDMFKDVVEITPMVKKDGGFTMKETLGEKYLQSDEFKNRGSGDGFVDFIDETQDPVLHVSDYNKVAALYGKEKVSINDNQYCVVADYSGAVDVRESALSYSPKITIAGKEYQPNSDQCVDGFLEMQGSRCNMGIIILPDSADFKDFVPQESFFAAKFNPNYSKGLQYIDDLLSSEKTDKSMGKYVRITTKSIIYNRSTGVTALVVFMGLYLGIIFIIASAALLSLKELSQAADSRDKYQILRNIGVDEKMINRSLLRQNLTFFAVPLILAIIHSIFGIQVCVYIIEAFGHTGLVQSIIFTAIMLMAIYTVYFIVTYRCSRRIIQNR